MATAGVAWASPRWLRRNSQYIAVFTELLRDSPQPSADLVELGLDPSLAAFAGTHPWTSGGPIGRPAFEAQFFARFGYLKLAGFYLRHPDRFVALTERALQSGLAIRPAALGNFEKSAGLPPQARSRSFALWSDLHASVLPGRAASFLALVVVLLVFPLVFWRRASPQTRLLLELQSAAVLMAVAEFLAVVFVQGDMDAARVMLPVDLLLDFAITVTAAEIAGGAAAYVGRLRGGTPSGAASTE